MTRNPETEGRAFANMMIDYTEDVVSPDYELVPIIAAMNEIQIRAFKTAALARVAEWLNDNIARADDLIADNAEDA